MKMTVGGLIAGALAVGALVGAGAAQAAPFEYIDNQSPHIKPVKGPDGKPLKDANGNIILENTNPSPWDFTHDVIKLPIGSIKFAGADDWGQNYGGSMGPRGADNDGPKRAKNPSE